MSPETGLIAAMGLYGFVVVASLFWSGGFVIRNRGGDG